MSNIIVERKSEWTNRGREIGLYLNNEKVGSIGNGEVKSYELQPGDYILRGKIDWCGSQNFRFSITENETKKVLLSSFVKNKWILPSIIFFNFLLIGLSYLFEIDQSIILGLLIMPLIYIFYPITLGRNRYLKLNECSLNQ